MTDPVALEPILPPLERTALHDIEELPHEERFDAFVAHVQAGGKVEAGDWMPDEYRQAVLRFVEMHANSELMGVLPERDWIMRAPTLRRKLALTAKIQDEVGHAQLLYRVAEDLGKTRDAMYDDLIAGQDEVPQRLPLPDADRGPTSGSSRGSSTPPRSSPSRRCATRATRRTRGRCARSAGRRASTSCTGAMSW